MEISFSNSRLQKLCNAENKLRGQYGKRMTLLIQQRLAELSAAETLADMRCIVAAHCHELKQNFKGFLAVSLEHPDRLVFRPANDPVPLKSDGGLDWVKVTSIEVIGIGDYH